MTERPAVFVAADVGARLTGLPRRPWEVGGWLLGYWTEDRSIVMVTHATPPGPRGTPWGIRVSGAGNRPRFDEAWDASGGLITFLGDWHTHPRGPALPSDRDRCATRLLSADENFGTPTPLIAIVAQPRLFSSSNAEIGWYVHVDDDLIAVEVTTARTMPEPARAVPAWRWPQDGARARSSRGGRRE